MIHITEGKIMRRFILSILGILLILPSFVFAESLSNNLGIGINYPGLSIKYGINSKNAIELKTQFEKDIFVIGPRYYYNFNSENRAVIFLGGEFDYVTFKGEYSKGTGLAASIFIGGEYFISPKFGLGLDIGSVYIRLRDKDTSLSESGVDFVLNFSLTYYFGKGREWK